MPTDFNSPEWLERERALRQRAGGGDRAAFEDLYRAFAGPLYRQVLLPRLGDPQTAQDALAETFRTCLERWADFQDRGVSLFFWLARIAANKALDHYRAQARKGRALLRFASLVEPLRVQPGAPDGDDENFRTSLRQAVTEVLSALNERYRQAIELRFLQECSREQCAGVLAVKLSTFDVLLLRALRSFRKVWEEKIGKAPEEV